MRVPPSIVAVLLFLNGCTLIPDYHRGSLPVSAYYPADPARPPSRPATAPVSGTPAWDLGWRDFFTDPVLQDLLAFSLDNNRDLLVAALNVIAAQSQARLAHANLFPTVDASASGVFEREPPGAAGFSSPVNLNAYSLSLGAASYELDVFGRLRSLSRQAQEQFFSQAESRESTQISLVAQIASEYLSWLSDRDALRVSEETVVAQARSYELRKATLQGGSGTALDVATAEATLRTAEASVQQYRRQVAQDLDQIVLLAGAPLSFGLMSRMEAETGLATVPPFPTLAPGLPAALLERRPDIRAAEHTLLAANANIGAARAAFFPSIVLTGSGGTGSGSLGQLFGAGSASWLFEPQISVPIFEFGKNRANLDYAKVETRIDVANYEKTIQSAFHDVSDALAAGSTDRLQVEAERKLVDADARYYDLSKKRFDVGIATDLDVLVAQNSLFSAQLTLISLELAARENDVNLYKALGGGWEKHL